jgi:hypothetical protein
MNPLSTVKTVIILWIVSCLALSSTSSGPFESKQFTDGDYKWWAVQPLEDSAIPEVANADWVRNPIDNFVLRVLQAAGLEPAPTADLYELVRRAYFDLHGLPPTVEQLEAFEVAAINGLDTAYTALIDELLESPRYGERWAQHWLDVTRFAESDGYRADGYRSTAYLYRDYLSTRINPTIYSFVSSWPETRLIRTIRIP